MRKLWFNSLAAVLLLTAACQRHSANEGGSDADSLSATNDSLAPADRTYVDPDTVPLIDTSNVGNDTVGSSTGDSKKPGPRPEPGKPNKVDSIKKTYPPKK